MNGMSTDCLAHCTFEKNKDLMRLYTLKRGNVNVCVAKTDELAVKMATTNKEMAQHRRCQTWGPKVQRA